MDNSIHYTNYNDEETPTLIELDDDSDQYAWEDENYQDGDDDYPELNEDEAGEPTTPELCQRILNSF